MAPILSFLSEEAYSHFKGKTQESIFLHDFPVAPKEWSNPELVATFAQLITVRNDVQKILEGLRAAKTIGASLEAKVTITAGPEILKTLQNYDKNLGLRSDLRELLIVSSVVLKAGDYKVEAEKADGQKCVRCWIYSDEVGKSADHPLICPKCIEALS